jgi:predicted aminopeptidase
MGYVLHAASGQFNLISESIPISEGLEQDILTYEQKERLRLVVRVKRFGVEMLGLRETGSYESVYLKDSRRPIYVVSASPKDRLELVTWWFPIVGKMPYLGFFDRTKADAEGKALIKKGLDVTLGVADAYSTLGWFDDPITRNLIEGPELDLVETILHEMTHATLFIKGRGDFNEGLANIVGKVGAHLFFQKNFGPSHPRTLESEALVEDQRKFSSFLNALLEKLNRVYQSGKSIEEKLESREIIFQRAVDEFERIKVDFKTGRFVYFNRPALNNAYLMSLGLYHRNFILFETALERHGGSVPAMLAYFKEAAKEGGNPLLPVAQ